MTNQKTDAEAALKKLGHRVHEGWAKKHPVPDQSIETVRTAVRHDWEQEQQARRTKKTSPAPPKTRHRGPEEPER